MHLILFELFVVLQRFDTNKEEFLRRVQQTVDESLTRVYDIPPPTNPLIFTEPKPAHQEMVATTIYNKKSSTQPSSAKKSPGVEDEDNRLTSSFFRSRIDDGDLPSASNRNTVDGAIAEIEKFMHDTDISTELSSSPQKGQNASVSDISVDSVDRPLSINDL